MTSKDEFLDLVDDNDRVIGGKWRSEIYAENLSNFRAVNAFVINADGQILIPRRSADKVLFPLCLDTSVGGHVKSGETYEEALKRELKEELCLDIEKVIYRFLGHLNPKQHSVSAFMQVYEIQAEEVPNYNKDDIKEYIWLYPSELKELIESGEKTKGDLPKLVLFFMNRDEAPFSPKIDELPPNGGWSGER